MDEVPKSKVPFAQWSPEDRTTYVDLFRQYMLLGDDIQALELRQHRIGRKADAIQQRYNQGRATA